MKKEKTTPVRIEESVYQSVKEYCDDNALKISRWISKILKERVNEERNRMEKELS